MKIRVKNIFDTEPDYDQCWPCLKRDSSLSLPRKSELRAPVKCPRLSKGCPRLPPWFRVHAIVLNDPGRLLSVHIAAFDPNDIVFNPMWRQGCLVLPFATRLGVVDSWSGWSMLGSISDRVVDADLADSFLVLLSALFIQSVVSLFIPALCAPALPACLSVRYSVPGIPVGHSEFIRGDSHRCVHCDERDLHPPLPGDLCLHSRSLDSTSSACMSKSSFNGTRCLCRHLSSRSSPKPSTQGPCLYNVASLCMHV